MFYICSCSNTVVLGIGRRTGYLAGAVKERERNVTLKNSNMKSKEVMKDLVNDCVNN